MPCGLIVQPWRLAGRHGWRERMGGMPTKKQLEEFGRYVYRCDPDMFHRWLEDYGPGGDYADES